MPTQIITMCYFFDELLKAIGHKDDVQTVLSTAEVMTVALVAAEFFTGNQQKALDFLTDHHYIKPFSISRSRERAASTAACIPYPTRFGSLPSFGDGGFLDRNFETVVAHQAGINLIVPRRKNMKEQLDAVVSFVCSKVRKQVETTFSQLTARMARKIHVVTPRGFELKTMLTVLAYSING